MQPGGFPFVAAPLKSDSCLSHHTHSLTPGSPTSEENISATLVVMQVQGLCPPPPPGRSLRCPGHPSGSPLGSAPLSRPSTHSLWAQGLVGQVGLAGQGDTG
jgi:hypothetical protein